MEVRQMLPISVPIGPEGWDETKEEFVTPKTIVLELEHSLVSISKWESKWHKAFLTDKPKTAEETLDYIKCMVLNDEIDEDVFNHLTQDNIDEINNYIKAPMTATVIRNESRNGGPGSKDVTTSELIYYWMITNNIPFECENWHLNRLLTLIKVCGVKNTGPNKNRNRSELARNYAAINKANRARFNSKG